MVLSPFVIFDVFTVSVVVVKAKTVLLKHPVAEEVAPKISRF